MGGLRIYCRGPYPDPFPYAAGPVGILAAHCAVYRGAARVIVIDEHAYRLARRPLLRLAAVPRVPAHVSTHSPTFMQALAQHMRLCMPPVINQSPCCCICWQHWNMEMLSKDRIKQVRLGEPLKA